VKGSPIYGSCGTRSTSSCKRFTAWAGSTLTVSPARLEPVFGELLKLNQATLYPALVQLEQQGWIQGKWDKTETAGKRILRHHQGRIESARVGDRTWREWCGLMKKLLGGKS
jgi:hypothetical protein